MRQLSTQRIRASQHRGEASGSGDQRAVSRCRRSGCGELVGLFPLMAIGLLMPTRSVAGQEVGEVFRDCDICPEMVVVPSESFLMGSLETDRDAIDWEKPQHRVTIYFAFAVGVYEVTFDEWDACVRGGGCGGHKPHDRGYGRGRHPVIYVSWEDAWLYADWLTEQTGEEYRLLTEAEWEYVARAGTQTAWYWGDGTGEQCQYANGDSSVGCRDRQEYTAPVGSYRPNGFGLYDVLGNVWEWVDDCWNGNYEGAPTDGRSWYKGDCTVRVLRGGSWYSRPGLLRSAGRSDGSTGRRSYVLGFRVARTMN